jgi:hypothetical protein
MAPKGFTTPCPAMVGALLVVARADEDPVAGPGGVDCTLD